LEWKVQIPVDYLLAETTKIWKLQAVGRLQIVWIIRSVHGLGQLRRSASVRFNSFNRSKEVSSFEVLALALAIAEDFED